MLNHLSVRIWKNVVRMLRRSLKMTITTEQLTEPIDKMKSPIEPVRTKAEINALGIEHIIRNPSCVYAICMVFDGDGKIFKNFSYFISSYDDEDEITTNELLDIDYSGFLFVDDNSCLRVSNISEIITFEEPKPTHDNSNKPSYGEVIFNEGSICVNDLNLLNIIKSEFRNYKINSLIL